MSKIAGRRKENGTADSPHHGTVPSCSLYKHRRAHKSAFTSLGHYSWHPAVCFLPAFPLDDVLHTTLGLLVVPVLSVFFVRLVLESAKNNGHSSLRMKCSETPDASSMQPSEVALGSVAVFDSLSKSSSSSSSFTGLPSSSSGPFVLP